MTKGEPILAMLVCCRTWTENLMRFSYDGEAWDIFKPKSRTGEFVRVVHSILGMK